MEKHAPALPAVTALEDECQRLRRDRSAFRLHTLSMNPHLLVMASSVTPDSGKGDLPVHWMLLDPLLAPVVHSSVAHEKELARWAGRTLACDAQLAAGVLVRLGLAGVTEPRTAPACALFAIRLLWRSAALTIAQHWDMERAAQARRTGGSHA
jgi:hypothetical protein